MATEWPKPVSFGEFGHDRMRRITHARFTPVRIDQQIGVDGNHRVPGSP